jgi:opacity protein-like surface antigen
MLKRMHFLRGPMIRYLPILLLATFLIVPEAGAQILPAQHREWEFEVFGGASYLGNHTYNTPVNSAGSQIVRPVGLRYAAGYQTGVRITENRWQHWGVTLEYSFSNQPATFTNLSSAVSSLRVGQSLHRLAYELLYYPLERSHRLRPYAFAGPGEALFHVHRDSKSAAALLGIQFNDPWKFSFHWGGGAKYLIQDHVAAGFQFSDAVSGVPHYGLPPVWIQSQPGLRPAGSLHNWRFGISLIYQWSR